MGKEELTGLILNTTKTIDVISKKAGCIILLKKKSGSVPFLTRNLWLILPK